MADPGESGSPAKAGLPRTCAMEGFVTSTPRAPDEDAPPLPKASIGKLPKGERPATLPRGQGELHKYVAAYADWSKKEKNAGSEQFRYLVRTMSEVETQLKTGEKTLKDLMGQVRGWQRAVEEQDAVAVYETTGEKMQQKLKDMRGDTGKKHIEKVYPPDGGLIAKLNESVLAMQIWIKEESELTQGTTIIRDRLIFGATNLPSLLDLRGRLVAEITKADAFVRQWQCQFAQEKIAAKIATAEKERRAAKAARTEQRTSPGALPMEERCQAIKAYPGQTDVSSSIPLVAGQVVFRLEDLGDGWSKVRLESDDKIGLVPTKRLRSAPLPPAAEQDEPQAEQQDARPPPPAVSDDEMDEEDSRAEAESAEEEARAEAHLVETAHAEELARMEADAAECGYGGD